MGAHCRKQEEVSYRAPWIGSGVMEREKKKQAKALAFEVGKRCKVISEGRNMMVQAGNCG